MGKTGEGGRTRSGFKRPLGMRLTVVIIAAAVVIGGGVTAFLIYRNNLNERKIDDYESSVEEDWQVIVDSSESVIEVMSRLESPDDMDALNTEVKSMREVLREAGERARVNPPPPGYEDVGEKEKKALEEIDGYLEKISQIAVSKDESFFEQETQILESRAKSARLAVTDFLDAASNLEQVFNGDFFLASELLTGAFLSPEELQNQREREEVYQTVETFMSNDIDDFNIDVIYSLISTRLRELFASINVTKEKLAENWTQLWDAEEDPPAAYYIDKKEIDFPQESQARVKVIVYRETGSPETEEIRVVREEDGWKIDSYPYVGWI